MEVNKHFASILPVCYALTSKQRSWATQKQNRRDTTHTTLPLWPSLPKLQITQPPCLLSACSELWKELEIYRENEEKFKKNTPPTVLILLNGHVLLHPFIITSILLLYFCYCSVNAATRHWCRAVPGRILSNVNTLKVIKLISKSPKLIKIADRLEHSYMGRFTWLTKTNVLFSKYLCLSKCTPNSHVNT